MEQKELTAVLINNEAYDALATNRGELIKVILNSLKCQTDRISNHKIGNFDNALTIVNLGHRDIPKLYLTHTSSLIELGYNNTVTNLEYRKGLLDLAKEIIKEEERIVDKLEKEKNRQL